MPPRSSKLIVAFGETLWDLFPSGPVLGGAPFNFAYRAHSLGNRAVILTRLGQDELGRRAARIMKELGMEADQVQFDPERPTGTVRVTTDAQGNPDFHILPGTAFDHIQALPQAEQLAGAAHCLYFGTLIQREEQSRDTLAKTLHAAPKALKFFDVNLRRDCFTPAIIEQSLLQADVLKMNLEEAHFLADEFEVSTRSLPAFCEEMIQDWSLTHCIVTLADHGALALSQKGETVYEPGFQVEVADTCGAGDAFSAAFVHGLLRGQSLRQCCRRGTALGALVASQPGATQPISPADLDQFLNAGRPRVAEPSLVQFAS